MIVAFTGHRPPKAGLTYSHNAAGDVFAVEATRRWLRENNVSHTIVGGALGFDTLAARASWLEQIPYVLAIPFEGFADRWPEKARERLAAMRRDAFKVEVVSPPGYAGWKLQKRNEWMVDRVDKLLAWYDGSPGGTRNCITYAKQRHVPVVELMAYAHKELDVAWQ